MTNPTATQFELDDLRDAKTKAEKEAEQAQRSRTIGLVAVLIGLLMLAFNATFWFGVFLIVAGGLAAVTQIGKRNEAQRKVAEINAQVAEIRKGLTG